MGVFTLRLYDGHIELLSKHTGRQPSNSQKNGGEGSLHDPDDKHSEGL